MNAACPGIARFAVLSAVLLLSACAGYNGRDLTPGVSTLPEVIASMGEPAMRWSEADGREQLAYPRGPAGTQTFMVFLAADGRLQRIDGVLNLEHFSRIEPGKSDKAAVLRLLGPSQTGLTAYFRARDELVWEWLFCNTARQQMFFDVLFNGTSGIVRSTAQRPNLVGRDNIQPPC